MNPEEEHLTLTQAVACLWQHFLRFVASENALAPLGFLLLVLLVLGVAVGGAILYVIVRVAG